MPAVIRLPADKVDLKVCRKLQGKAEPGNTCLQTPGTCESCPEWWNRPKSISFTVLCKPEPQGSVRAFMPKGWKRPILTSDNKDLKSFRQEVAGAALRARKSPDLMFAKHQPVEVSFAFYFQRPPSIPKKRTCHVVKPDLSKLVRAAEDALTGIIYQDDAQIVRIHTEKHYGLPERVYLQVSEYLPNAEEGENNGQSKI